MNKITDDLITNEEKIAKSLVSLFIVAATFLSTFLLAPFCFMLLWNQSMPIIFKLQELSFYQAYIFSILIYLVGYMFNKIK